MPTFTDYSLDLAHYVRIEGIGVPTTASNEMLGLYIFDRLPDSNWTASATQRFIDGLRLVGGFSQSVEPYGGIGEVSGATFEVQDFRSILAANSGFWAQLMATERWNNDPAGFPHTYLNASMDRDDVTMTVLSTAGFPAAPSHVWIGPPGNQECVRYTGLGATTFTGLTRGQFPATGNAFARTHRVGNDEDGNPLAPVLVSTRPQSFFGLRVVVRAIARRRDGTWEPEASAVRRYTGFIRHHEFDPSINGFRFKCDGLMQALDRDLYTPARHYRSQIVGVYLGPRVEDRSLTLYPLAVPITVTLADDWYESADFLRGEINQAISADWRTNNRDYRTIPLLTLEEGVHRWLVGRLIGGSFYGVAVEMPHGISEALGRFANDYADINDANASSGPFFTVPAELPSPATSLYWPVGFDGDITLRVASREGVITNQGDFSAGPILIGGLYAARVTGSAAGTLVDTLTVRSMFDGRPFAGIDNASGITILADADGNSIVEEGAGHWRMRGSAFVEQVFVPSGGVGLGVTLGRMIVSTGTANYNSTYDVLADGYGAGIDDDDVDRLSFPAAVFNAGLRDNEAFRYLIRAATPLRTILNDVFGVLGIAVVMVAGRLTARAATPFGLARQAVADIDDNALSDEQDLAGYKTGPLLYATGLKIRWSWDWVNEEFGYPPLTIHGAAAVSGAENRLIEIESKGLTGSPARIAETELANVIGWLGVFNRPVARISLSLSARWVGRLVPSDVVTVSLSSLHNKFRGIYGTDSLIGVVTSVEEPWYAGGSDAVKVGLILLNEQRQAPLAPSAMLDYSRGDGGWDAANNRLYLRDSEFTDAPDLDVLWFEANDRILLCQDNPADPTAPLLWRVTVLSVTNGGVGSRYLTLTAALPGPAFDVNQQYFVTMDTYDVVPSARYDDATWIADDADSRIGATTAWYPYT